MKKLILVGNLVILLLFTVSLAWSEPVMKPRIKIHTSGMVSPMIEIYAIYDVQTMILLYVTGGGDSLGSHSFSEIGQEAQEKIMEHLQQYKADGKEPPKFLIIP